ncbi:MAG TPA: GIY-YIG nuclease family protein [Rhodanobacteraceae bacterium]
MLVIPAKAGIQRLCLFNGMHKKQPAVYILANERNGTLYIGVTSDLIQRIWQHRNDVVDGFSRRYRTHKLVYFEQHASMEAAIVREKQIKKWNRAWKLELIEKHNPYWRDLYLSILDGTENKDTGFPLSRE